MSLESGSAAAHGGKATPYRIELTRKNLLEFPERQSLSAMCCGEAAAANG